MGMFDAAAGWLLAREASEIIGWALTILSTLVALWIYLRSRRAREARFSIRTFQLMKGKSATVPGLAMRFHGREISDLSVSKIAFWSSGKETLRADDVASTDPLRVVARRGTEILDAKIVHVNVPANGFSLAKPVGGSSCRIDFEYVDFMQGSILQILHTGDAESIDLRGVLKGAGAPKRRRFRSPAEYLQTFALPDIAALHPRKRRTALVASLSFGTAMGLGLFLWVFRWVAGLEEWLGNTILSVFVLASYWGPAYFALRRPIPKGFHKFEDDLVH